MAKKNKVYNLRWTKIIITASILSIATYFGYQSLIAPAQINLISGRNNDRYQMRATIESQTKTDTPHLKDPTVPNNCTTWFDGCNTCQAKDGVLTSCTRKVCRDEGVEPRCLVYSNAPAEPSPSSTLVSTPTQVLSSLVNFKVSGACGPNSFLNISFTCSDKPQETLADNTCLDFNVAYHKATNTCSR